MGFFDLNIPFYAPGTTETSNNKTTRILLATKSMELGYTGVAYNRTIKIEELKSAKSCSIERLTLSSLLKLHPSLSSSVNFHRHLLGIPTSSPFRQYTRLTVCVDKTARIATVFNSRESKTVLDSYDVVAVRPLNQSAFELACEKAEVHIISINLSTMPFRLKRPFIASALKRGLYFEICYSDLFLDAQAKKSFMTNAKLLVDCTRGKNLILSSAAPSVTELRGPNDVANLASLLGFSSERAKAAISKNCRNLLANLFKKKRFKEEAIRLDLVSSSGDWLKWDPISCGEGDLLLEDMEEAFASINAASKSVKAIDFTSAIDNKKSPGFLVSGIISGMDVDPQLPTISKSLPLAITVADQPLMDLTTSANNPSDHEITSCRDSQILCLTKDSARSEEVGLHTIVSANKFVPLKKCSFGHDIENEKARLQDNVCNANRGAPKEYKNTNRSLKICKSLEHDASMSLHDSNLCKIVREEGPLAQPGDTTVVGDQTPSSYSCHEIKVDNSPVGNCEDQPLVINLDDVSSEVKDLEGEAITTYVKEQEAVDHALVTVESSDQNKAPDGSSLTHLCKEKAETHINVQASTVNDAAEDNGLKGEATVGCAEERVPINQVPVLEGPAEERVPTNQVPVLEGPAEERAPTNQVPVIDSCKEKKTGDEAVLAYLKEDREEDAEDSNCNPITSLQSISGKSRLTKRKSHRLRMLPFNHFLNSVPSKRRRKNK